MKRSWLVIFAFLCACEGTPKSPVASVPLTTTLKASSLSAPVDVVRDEHGIPHIYGSTLPDVSYAEGYVMAQDRMVEMDLSRRSGEGKLAELLGALSSSLIVSDIQMRLYHLQETSQQAFAQLQASSDPDDQEIVKSLTEFAAGVNAWVADVAAGKQNVPGAYAAFYDPTTSAPWTEVDTLVLGRLLCFQLSFDGTSDALRSMLDSAAGVFASDPSRAQIARDLEILAPVDPTFTLPGGWKALTSSDTSARRMRKHRQKEHPLPASIYRGEMLAMRDLGRQRITEPDKGSNNFVIGPSKSTDGHVLVANDTHLQLSNPPVFYLVHLVVSNPARPLDVMGVQFPGVPGVILGMNQHIAWGATVNNLDVTDTYRESVVTCAAGNGVPCTQTKTGLQPLTPRQESFNVGYMGKVDSTVNLTFYDVPNHGPITPRILTSASGPPTLDALHIGGTEMSVRWTGDEPTQEIRALLHLDRAGTMQEGVQALDADFKTGGQNWVIGDDQGHIGWTQTIRLPRRPAGVVPWKVVAGDGSADWLDDLDPRYIPHAYDPQQGFLATANADPIGVTADDDPFEGAPVVDGIFVYLGADFDPGTRVGRITKRLNAQAKLSIDDVQSVQADAITEYGPLYAPTFLDAAQAIAEEAATPGTHPELTALVSAAPAATLAMVQPAHDLVAGWTDDTPAAVVGAGAAPTAAQISDSKATAIIAMFTGTLAHRALDDELQQMGVTVDDIGSQPIRKLLARMCTQPTTLSTGHESNGDSILFDDLTTSTVETKRTTAAAAVIDALTDLGGKGLLGPDMSAWRWGTIHTLTLAGLLPLATLSIPSPSDPSFPDGYPRHGDDGTVDVGNHGLSLTDFTYDEGPAIRFACELTPEGPVARNVLPGGETFDPSSPHYSDEWTLWRQNQTFDLAYQTSDVTASAAKEYAANHDGRVRFTP